MIQFQCSQCGQTMQAEDKHQGQKVRCSGCNNIVAIPVLTVPTVQAAPQPPLTMVTSPDMYCPSCGGPLPAQAVLCVNCGYNRKTGKYLQTKIKRKRVDKYLEPFPALVVRLVAWLVLAWLPLPLVFLAPDFQVILGILLVFMIWALLLNLALGTFIRVRVHRDEAGDLILTKPTGSDFFR